MVMTDRLRHRPPVRALLLPAKGWVPAETHPTCPGVTFEASRDQGTIAQCYCTSWVASLNV